MVDNSKGNVLIIFSTIIFLIIFVGGLTYIDKLILTLPLALILMVDLFLKFVFHIRIEVRMIYYLMLLFIIIEFSAGWSSSYDPIKSALNNGQLAMLILILFYNLITKKIPKSKELRSVIIFMVFFILFNLISTMYTYGNPTIFIKSTLDYCKYFLLIFIIFSSKSDEKDVYKLLQIYSPIVVFGFILCFLQVIGVEKAFDPFRGYYDIQFRSGMFRAIGFFPYPIEFGNYSVVLFCLYYFLNKYKYKTKWFSFVSFMLFMSVLFTGTRISLIALIFVLVLNSLKSLKQVIVTRVTLVLALLIISPFYDIQRIIDDTKNEYTVVSPREYYIDKGIEVWKEYPVFGIGYNTFGNRYYRDITNDYIFGKFGARGFDWAKLSTTDTFYAQILPEFGTVGLLLLIFFGIFIYRRHKFISKADKSNRAFFYIIITTFIMAANSSGVLFNQHIGSFLWISIGFILYRSHHLKISIHSNNKNNNIAQ